VEAPATAAGTWRLGDREVNRLGFGAMRLTGSLPFGNGAPSDRDRSIAVLRRAVELGVNHIDTAAFYFSPLRSANELINTALVPYPEDLVIVTKVGPGRDPWGEWYSARPDQLRGQVEENLRQLGRDHLDVVNLRRMRQPSIAEHFGALAELRDAGLIRHLGVSDVSVAQLAEATAIAPVVCVHNRYGLDLREHDTVLRACAEQGIAFVPFFAVAGMARRPPRSGWRGRCIRAPTCWPSPAPATPATSRKTWPRRRCGCPRKTSPCWSNGARWRWRPLPPPPGASDSGPPNAAGFLSGSTNYSPRRLRPPAAAGEPFTSRQRSRPAPAFCASRSRSRCSRTCNRRSSSVVPPHTPCIWRVASANCRHWRRTWHDWHTALARAMSSWAGPREDTGKNSSGSAVRQAADVRQSPRTGRSPRWLGS